MADETSASKMPQANRKKSTVLEDLHAVPANGGRFSEYLKPSSDETAHGDEQEECSKKEEWGWYSFDFANSVYSAVVLGLMGPLLVNGLAKKKTYGKIAQCSSTGDIPDENYTQALTTIQNYRYDRTFDQLVYPPSCEVFNRVQQVESNGYTPNVCLMCFANRGNLLYDCNANGTHAERWSVPTGSVDFGPLKLGSFSFTTTLISLSVIFQAILFIMVGPCADYGNNRKTLMIAFTLVGILSTIGLFFVYDQNRYDVGGVLLIISNVCYGLTIVFYNAYLPLLVDAHPEVKKELEDAKKEGATDIAERMHKKRDSVERKMSDFGFASGYVGGPRACLIVLFVCIPIAFFSPDADSGFVAWLPYRICILLAAIWWFSFSIPTFLFVRKRGGPDYPESKCCGKHPARVLVIGAESTISTLWHARQNKQTLLFLLCYFIYSDSYNTMASVGILFGSDVLCMDQVKLLITNLIIQLAAVIGIYFYQKLDHHCKCCKLGSKGVIIVNLGVYLFLTFVGMVGFFDSSPIGLKTQEEFFVFSVVFGLHMGSIQSYTRTTFGDMIPPGKENQYFALYEISDKGSSWLGPMIVAVLYEQTGSIRTAFIYLAVVLIIPILMLLFCINIKEGIESAGKTGKLADGGTSKGVEMPKVKVCVGPSSVDDAGVGSSAADDVGVGSSAADKEGTSESTSSRGLHEDDTESTLPPR